MTGSPGSAGGGQTRVTRRALLSPKKLLTLTSPSVDEAAVRHHVEGELRASLADTAGILFSCVRSEPEVPAGWAMVELPGLRLLSIGWILQVRARGVPTAISTCGGACCANAVQTVELADQLLNTGAVVSGLHDDPLRLDEPYATSQVLVRGSGVAAAPAIVDQRSPLGLLTIARDRCTLCGACAIACPTRALTLDEATDAVSLVHDPTICNACNLCVERCPEDALDLRRGIDVARLRRGPMPLAATRNERCTVCGTQLPPAPMLRKLRQLLPEISDAPLQLCTACAVKTSPARHGHRHGALREAPVGQAREPRSAELDQASGDTLRP